ncbi:hypothetical protein CB1_000327025 [Camelus ferus]|nr:hypothetical protein CB1_000327025 [Camelus ferus]
MVLLRPVPQQKSCFPGSSRSRGLSKMSPVCLSRKLGAEEGDLGSPPPPRRLTGIRHPSVFNTQRSPFSQFSGERERASKAEPKAGNTPGFRLGSPESPSHAEGRGRGCGAGEGSTSRRRNSAAEPFITCGCLSLQGEMSALEEDESERVFCPCLHEELGYSSGSS